MSITTNVSRIVLGSPAKPAITSINGRTTIVAIYLSRNGYGIYKFFKRFVLLLLKLILVNVDVQIDSSLLSNIIGSIWMYFANGSLLNNHLSPHLALHNSICSVLMNVALILFIRDFGGN